MRIHDIIERQRQQETNSENYNRALQADRKNSHRELVRWCHLTHRFMVHRGLSRIEDGDFVLQIPELEPNVLIRVIVVRIAGRSNSHFLSEYYRDGSIHVDERVECESFNYRFRNLWSNETTE